MNLSVEKKQEISSSKNFLLKNNKPFFYLADTLWFACTKRCPWPKVFQQIIKDRKQKGFNAIQLVIGIPPEVDIFSENAANSGGLPFNKDHSLNLNYFEEVDKKIKFIVDQNLVPVIFGGWGHHIDILGVEPIKQFWAEIIKRYSKYPVIFCLTGEVDGFLNRKYSSIKKVLFKIPRVHDFLSRIKQNQLHKSQNQLFGVRLQKWEEVAKFIKTKASDVLLTVHPQSMISSSKVFNNPNWLDINSIQSGHSKDRLEFLIDETKKSQKVKLPFINLEPWYENILNQISDYDIRVGFWASILNGAKGHSYGANGLWQMQTNDGFLGHWGETDWKKALNFPGATELGITKRFLEQLEWWKLKPGSQMVKPQAGLKQFAASINNQEFLIYLARYQNPTLTLQIPKIKGDYKIKLFQPKSLKKIKETKLISNKITVPTSKKNEDLLILISHAKEKS